VIGAPYSVSLDLMNHFKVDVVLHGQTQCDPDEDGRDPYEVPKGLNKFKQIDSGNSMSTADIITRIIENRLEFERRNSKKEAKEKAAYEAFQKLKSENKHESHAVNISNQTSTHSETNVVNNNSS